MLDWRTVTPSREPKFMVRGTELSVAIVPNTLHRFQICEIRTVRRADVARFDNEADALAWCAAHCDPNSRA